MLKDLNLLKSKLELLEKTLEDKTEAVMNKQQIWKVLDERVKEIRLLNESDEIININVGGKKFATTTKTLMKVKDTLFYKVLISKRFDLKKEIFIDRSGNTFKHILEYFRTGKFVLEKFNQEELDQIKEEVEYYDILPLEKLLKDVQAETKYVHMEVSSYYPNVGSTDPNVLLDRNLATGVCTNTNGWIILELNGVRQISEIEIGGFTGASDWVYTTGYGANARIETSLDKSKWTFVGTVPSGFGTTIMTVKVTKSLGKYIRIVGTSWLGIGFLKITK